MDIITFIGQSDKPLEASFDGTVLKVRPSPVYTSVWKGLQRRAVLSVA